MHTVRTPLMPALTGRRLRRAACAAWCVTVVVLGHGALWWIGSREAVPPAARAAAVQVRQLTVPSISAPVPTPPATVAPRVAHAAVAPRSAVRPQRNAPARDEADTAVAAARELGAAGSEPYAATGSSASPAPVYPTRIPASVQLHFTLRRGDVVGEANLDWRVEDDGYVLQLQTSMPHGRAAEQRSQGGFDSAGLAPLRLADRRRGRDVRAANFQREHGKISFSGPRQEWPLYGGAQDRVSWLVQLVAIVGAAPEALHEGAEVLMWVASARGALGIWRFEVRGREPPSSGDARSVWWLVREPVHPYDVRVEVWLDPDRSYWPVRLRQTRVPGGEPLHWTLRAESIAEPRS